MECFDSVDICTCTKFEPKVRKFKTKSKKTRTEESVVKMGYQYNLVRDKDPTEEKCEKNAKERGTKSRRDVVRRRRTSVGNRWAGPGWP